MKKIVFITSLICCFITYKAQSLVDQKKLSRDAFFFYKNGDFFSALKCYEKLIELNPKNDDAHVSAFICKTNLNYISDSLLPHESRLKNAKGPDGKYCLALLSHSKKNFDEAENMLTTLKKKKFKNIYIKSDDVNYQLEVNRNAKLMVSNPKKIVIKNLGEKVNSSYPDYIPIASSDESVLYFTSRRKGGTTDKLDEYGYYYEDIYISRKQNQVWQKAENAGAPLNTEVNDACLSLSPDGFQILIYRKADGARGLLCISRLNEQGKWDNPKPLGPEVNSTFNETSACFTNDTSEIYFCSDRPGGYGGKDIYRIKKLPNGKWSAAYNLGPNINTSRNEESPFMHPDGSTFYFSSQGHNTMGGYDIFKSSYDAENNKFTKAENLGYPLNGVGDDMFFIVNVNAQKAYYSSHKNDGFGSSDIYEIDTRFNENDLVVKNGVLFKDNILGKGKITLLDNETNKVTGIYNSNPRTGKFVMIISPFKSYKLIVQEEGYHPIVMDIEPGLLENEETALQLKLIKK